MCARTAAGWPGLQGEAFLGGQAPAQRGPRIGVSSLGMDRNMWGGAPDKRLPLLHS